MTHIGVLLVYLCGFDAVMYLFIGVVFTNTKKKQLLGAFYCLAAAVIWGLSFVAQSVSADSVTTFTFNFARNMLGGVVLLPVIAFRAFKAKKTPAAEGESEPENGKKLALGGTLCGIALFAGINLQQEAFACGLEAGKVGFITALYMLLVPVFGLALGKRPKANVWVGVAIGTVGLYLICVKKGSFSLGRGEIITLLGAVAFALHILTVDHFADAVDAVKLSCVQFFVCGVLSGAAMLIFEEPSFEMIKSGIIYILYAGIMSSGVAFTFQTFGQKYTEPAVASLLLCLESAFSLIFGWLILRQSLGTRALIGCGIMLAAVILTQIEPGGKKKGSPTNS